VNRLWEYYGARDPYYGVLSAEEFRIERMDSSARERFFASGVGSVEECLSLAERTFGPVTYDTALDYGCGVGRLSRALSRRFHKVIAIDISEAMLSNARSNLTGCNVSFENAARMTDEPAAFILSQMVFQHIPAEVGLRILPSLIRRLRGTGIIEFPVRDKASVTWRLLRRGRRALKTIAPIGPPIIPMYCYDKTALLAAFGACQVHPVAFETEMFDNLRVVFHRPPWEPGRQTGTQTHP
jgi:SAM-dependent methyltransferase